MNLVFLPLATFYKLATGSNFISTHLTDPSNIWQDSIGQVWGRDWALSIDSKGLMKHRATHFDNNQNDAKEFILLRVSHIRVRNSGRGSEHVRPLGLV